MSVYFKDITDRKHLDQTLHNNEERFRLLSSTAERLLRAHDPQVIVEDICRDVMNYLDCQTFFNFLADETLGKLRLNACAGIPAEDARSIEWMDYGTTVCGCVAQTQQRIIAEDILHTSDERTDFVKSYGIQAFCCHPLMSKERLVGTLSFGTKTRIHFTSDEVDLMRIVADQVAEGMQRKQVEDNLRKRTAQLEAAYKELESFSYSISHDLRTPLRAIDGFSRMLLKKHGDEFDEDSLRKFKVIRSNAQQMGQLIDDILALSRLTRTQMSVERLDMTGIIREVWNEIQVETPFKNVRLTVGSMPPALGDRTIIKQVLANLLGNAVKFTRFRDTALIEAGGHVSGKEIVYHIKDNGVGFKMEYHDKLFGLFQRLHSEDHFEGTGIGLATVRRVIQRHGGRTWAEGRVGEGATFYFSLPLICT